MKLFNFGKKDNFLDLSKHKNQEDEANTESLSEDFVLDSDKIESPEEKKQKFVKRIADLTDKIEGLSNQIYHLQQRIELLEKKANINLF